MVWERASARDSGRLGLFSGHPRVGELTDAFLDALVSTSPQRVQGGAVREGFEVRRKGPVLARLLRKHSAG